MKAFFKYSGGKTKEIKNIIEFIPESSKRIIEPFSGSGAVSFHFEKPSVLCDIRKNNISTFRGVRDNFEEIQEYLNSLKQMDVLELEKIFYHQRDEMFGCTSDLDIAKRWITIRQLAFSGMDRINNKTGKFNAPFGWYKQFSCNLTEEHSNFLKKCTLIEDDFSEAFKGGNPDDFIFIDPPYLNRNSTYGGNSQDDLHERLLDCCKKTSSRWLLIHVDNEFYRESYKEFNIKEFNFKYSQNFKKAVSHINSHVKHLYIFN